MISPETIKKLHELNCEDVARRLGLEVNMHQAHCFIIILDGGVNREHAGSASYTQYFFSGQLPVNIAVQCGKEVYLRYMLFSI